MQSQSQTIIIMSSSIDLLMSSSSEMKNLTVAMIYNNYYNSKTQVILKRKITINHLVNSVPTFLAHGTSSSRHRELYDIICKVPP